MLNWVLPKKLLFVKAQLTSNLEINYCNDSTTSQRSHKKRESKLIVSLTKKWYIFKIDIVLRIDQKHYITRKIFVQNI